MSEQVKFYLDEHVHPAIKAGLQRRGIDVLSAQDVGMLSASDEDHLAFATREGRVIFSQDDDFLRLHASGKEHMGIIYVHQRTSVSHILRGLVLIYQLLSPDEMKNRVEFL